MSINRYAVVGVMLIAISLMPIQMASSSVIRMEDPEYMTTTEMPMQDIPLPKLFRCYCNLPECMTTNTEYNTCDTRQGCFSELQAILPDALAYTNCTSDNTTTQCFTTATSTVTTQSPIPENDKDETVKFVLSSHNMDGSYGCLEFIPTNKTCDEILRNLEFISSEFPRLRQSEINSTNDVIRAYHCCQDEMCNDRMKVAAIAKAVQNALMKTFTNSNNPYQTVHEELLTNSEFPQLSPILTTPKNISATTNDLLHLIIPNITADIPTNYPAPLSIPTVLSAEKGNVDNDDLAVTNKTTIIKTTILPTNITTKIPYEIVQNVLQSKDNSTHMETNDKDITSNDNNSTNTTHVPIPNVDYIQGPLPIISIFIAKINNPDNNVSYVANEFPNINTTISYANTTMNIPFETFNNSLPSIAQLLLINYTELSSNITNMINNNTANMTTTKTQITQEDLPTNLIFVYHPDLLKTENIKDTTLIPQLFPSIPENSSITDTHIDAVNHPSFSIKQIISTSDAKFNNNITKFIGTTGTIMLESPITQEEHLVFEPHSTSLQPDTTNSSTNMLENLLIATSLDYNAEVNTKYSNGDQEIIESVPLPTPAALKSQENEFTLEQKTVEIPPLSLPSVEQYFTTLFNNDNIIKNSIDNSTTERITTASMNTDATYNSSSNVTAISPNLYNNTISKINVTLSTYTNNVTVASTDVTTPDNINYKITSVSNNSVILDDITIISNIKEYSITTTNITESYATTTSYNNITNITVGSSTNDLSTQTTIIVANGTSDVSNKSTTEDSIMHEIDAIESTYILNNAIDNSIFNANTTDNHTLTTDLLNTSNKTDFPISIINTTDSYANTANYNNITNITVGSSTNNLSTQTTITVANGTSDVSNKSTTKDSIMHGIDAVESTYILKNAIDNSIFNANTTDNHTLTTDLLNTSNKTDFPISIINTTDSYANTASYNNITNITVGSFTNDLSTQTTIIVANGTSDVSNKSTTEDSIMHGIDAIESTYILSNTSETANIISTSNVTSTKLEPHMASNNIGIDEDPDSDRYPHVIIRRHDNPSASGLQPQQQQNNAESTSTTPSQEDAILQIDVAPNEFPMDKEQDEASHHHIERSTEVEQHRLPAALAEFCDWLIGITGLLALFGIIVVSILVLAGIKIIRKADIFSTSVGLCRVPGQPCPCMTNIGLLDVNRIHSQTNTITHRTGPVSPTFPASTNGENINNGYNYTDSTGTTTYVYTKIPVPTSTPLGPQRH